MPKRKDFDIKRVVREEKMIMPKIRKICKEKLFFKENIFYIMYKMDDDTYPDVGIITEYFYNRPKFEHIGRSDSIDILEKFINFNIKEREKVAKLVEELCELPYVDTIKIEEIFDKYVNILQPICELYKFCYLIPAECRMLEIRHHDGEETVLGKSDYVNKIIRYARGEITKEEAKKLNVWEERILPKLSMGDIVEKVTCVSVDGYEKELNSPMFTHKRGQIIPVRPYTKLMTKKNLKFEVNNAKESKERNKN